jgi:c-di-GMP-binding flagellar brake protein YcgR
VDLPTTDDRIELISPRFPNARFLSRVRETKGKRLIITAPILAGEPMSLTRGERISLRWHEDTLFISEVMATRREGHLAEVEVLESLPRQRRGYFRWIVPLPLRFAVIQDVRGPFQTALTLDVSGGGICVPWSAPIEKGTELQLELALDREPVRALARVVDLRPNPAPPPPFHLALEFIRISDPDRSRIVRFVFQKQWTVSAR